MKIFYNTKIYMLCPANIHSGGPELCHQLVSQLLQFGFDAYMYYLPNRADNFNPENPIDDFYKKYHCPYVLDIEDEPQNILVLNESVNWAYYSFRNIRKIFWWMSVDNYIANVSNLIAAVKNDALAQPMPQFFYFQKDSTEHWVQSEYARQFVELNGVPKKQVYFVEDYLNQAFLSNAENVDLSKKENIVAFNPAKGFEVTQELIKIAPYIHWAPIKNMTPAQVQLLLSLSKVYIDFGNHPGKDRIPREAALSGCVVIVGKRGAAANDIDINIPDEFKFDAKNSFGDIIKKIQDSLDNFEENYLKQADYRARILDDKPRFAKEVAAAFKITPPEIELLALPQGFSEKGLIFIEILCSNNIIPAFIIDDFYCDIKNLKDNPYVKVYKNEVYYIPENYVNGGGYGIMIISSADAKFLYIEGRINKFAIFNPDDEEYNFVLKNLNSKDEDILIVNS